MLPTDCKKQSRYSRPGWRSGPGLSSVVGTIQVGEFHVRVQRRLVSRLSAQISVSMALNPFYSCEIGYIQPRYIDHTIVNLCFRYLYLPVAVGIDGGIGKQRAALKLASGMVTMGAAQNALNADILFTKPPKLVSTPIPGHQYLNTAEAGLPSALKREKPVLLPFCTFRYSSWLSEQSR